MSGKRVKVDTVLARSLAHFLLRSAFPIFSGVSSVKGQR